MPLTDHSAFGEEDGVSISKALMTSQQNHQSNSFFKKLSNGKYLPHT